MKTKASGSHVIGVPVTSKAYAIEETTSDRPAPNKDGDRLAVSLTHPSPYSSFGYKHSSKGQVIHWVNKLGRRAQSFRDHACDIGSQVIGDGEGEAEPGREDPAGRRRGTRVPAGLLGRERRAPGEGPPVLPLHHRRAHSWDALRLHPQDRLPQRPLPRRHLPGWRRRRPGAVQGRGSPEADQEGEAERERRQAGAEVHPGGHRGRVRVLVHGVRQLPEMLQVHAAGDLRAVAIDRRGAGAEACERSSYISVSGSRSEVCVRGNVLLERL